MELEIQLGDLTTSPLVGGYLNGEPEIAAHFVGHPFSLDSFRQHAVRLRERFDLPARRQAAEALRPTSDRARRRLDRFIEEGGGVVVTGQQAGLFSGPLYTVHKALTAVRLAEELEHALGFPVLPVFWAASEDHDWAEVNHAYLVGPRDSLHRLEAGSGDDRPVPMSVRRFGPGLESALEELAQIVAGQPHADDVLNRVRASYSPGRTVAGAFRELVASLFEPFDLLITDAADPALKQASVPVLDRELTSRARHEELLRATAARLSETGSSPQVPILEGASNLFLQTEHGRERLFAAPRGWITRESGARYTTDELAALLAREPERFSPNVLLRPVVESNVFPVLAYVAGPGELAYFAQLRSLFEAHAVTMPIVYPRASVRLVEPETRQRLDRLGLSIDDLRRPRHQLIRDRGRASMPPGVADALHELRESLVRGFDRLAGEAAAVEPTLRGMVGARRNRALLAVADAESRLLRSLSRDQADWAAVLDAVTAHLAPLGSEQERVLNVLPFLARHGTALLERIASAIPISWSEAPGSPTARSRQATSVAPR